MGFDGYGWGWGPITHFIWIVVSGISTIFAFLVVAGLLFVLVRFLLVATKAAQIYVAKNSPPKPVAPPAPAAPVAPAAPAAAAAAAPVTPPAKPTPAPAAPAAAASAPAAPAKSATS